MLAFLTIFGLMLFYAGSDLPKVKFLYFYVLLWTCKTYDVNSVSFFTCSFEACQKYRYVVQKKLHACDLASFFTIDWQNRYKDFKKDGLFNYSNQFINLSKLITWIWNDALILALCNCRLLSSTWTKASFSIITSM